MHNDLPHCAVCLLVIFAIITDLIMLEVALDIARTTSGSFPGTFRDVCSGVSAAVYVPDYVAHVDELEQCGSHDYAWDRGCR